MAVVAGVHERERESQREEEERMGNLGFLAAAEGFL
jgi:hypothetical protein